MPSGVTNDEMIARFKSKHGERYDYSKTKYESYRSKVTVTCRMHGDFRIAVRNHLRGSGCPACGEKTRARKIIRKCNDEFINKARSVHGDKYDYSLVKYVNAKSDVKIICQKHGMFLQQPSYHLSGNGCKRCALEHASMIKKDAASKRFFKLANKLHGSKYDYSLTNYINSYTTVDILCRRHGIFKQLPTNHLLGHGCPRCNFSHLERAVCIGLDKDGIQYLYQKRFSWLGLQSFDFYIPSKGVAIECQGEQHFNVVERFGGERQLKIQLKRDELKYCLAKEHNINLIYYCDKKFTKRNDGNGKLFFTEIEGLIRYINSLDDIVI